MSTQFNRGMEYNRLCLTTVDMYRSLSLAMFNERVAFAIGILIRAYRL